jgi:sulfur-carrier protein
VKVQIRYFASIREGLGVADESFDTQAGTLGALRDELLARSPAHAEWLARNRAVRLALDHAMADETAALRDGCEVAFFPPVTGG